MLTPTDQLQIDFTYFNFESRNEQRAGTWISELDANSNLLNCGVFNPIVRPPGPGLGAGGQWFRLYCGELPVLPIPVDPRAYGSQMEANFTRLGVSYDITDQIQLEYVYGRVGVGSYFNQYADVLPGCTFSSMGTGENITESHDTRLTFDNGENIRAAVGYLNAPYRNYDLGAFGSAAPLTAPPQQSILPYVATDYTSYFALGRSLTKNRVKSPFAEVSVTLMEGRLRLGGEIRHTSEKRFQQALASGGGGLLTPVPNSTFTNTYKSTTPRLTVEYDVADEQMIYASAARGVKSGGFNPTAFQPQFRVFTEDSNWTYEIGSKNTFGSLRLNATAFLIKWSNMQVPAADPGNPAPLPIVITLNVGNLTSKGFELESAYAVNENFTLNATAYYGNPTYDNGTFDLNFARTPRICDNVVCPTNGDISGKRTPRSSKFMATFGAEWNADVPGSSDMEYFMRGDLTYQSKAYSDVMNLAWAPSRTLFNASLGFTAESYDIQFWVRNLFNEEYVSVAGITQPNVGYFGNIGDHRTAGATVRIRY